MTTDPRPTSPATTASAIDEDKLFPTGMQKALAASGIVFALLVILSIIIGADEHPDFGAGASEWRELATDGKDDNQASALLGLLGVLFFVMFVGVVRSALARTELQLRGFTRGADIALAGGILAATGVAIAIAMGTAAASQPADTPDEVVRAMFHLADSVWAAAVVGFAVFLLNAGMLIVRTGALPRWIGWVAVVSSVAWAITLLSVLEWEDSDSVFAAFWIPGNLLLLVFAIATSVVLIRRVGKPWPLPGGGSRTGL